MDIEKINPAVANISRDPRQDPDFDPIAESRQILRTTRVATLATLMNEGAPFASLTTIATAHDGAPILLLSRLAHHTRFLERDGRCSLLLAKGGRGDPLAHPRLTLVGTAARIHDPVARARFLRRNPKAGLYADFPDFSFWRLTITAVHLNGGFARAADFAPEQLLVDTHHAEPLFAVESDIIDHMNTDHADALKLYAEHYCAAGSGPWRASGIDPEGLDLVCGDLTARVVFSAPVKTPEQARIALGELARQARGQAT